MRFDELDDPDPPSPPEDLFETVLSVSGTRARNIAGIAAVLALLVGSGLFATRTGERPHLTVPSETTAGSEPEEGVSTTNGGDQSPDGLAASEFAFAETKPGDDRVLAVGDVPPGLTPSTGARYGEGVLARAMWRSGGVQWMEIRVNEHDSRATQELVEGLSEIERPNGRTYWVRTSDEQIRIVWIPGDGVSVTLSATGLDTDELFEVLDGTEIRDSDNP